MSTEPTCEYGAAYCGIHWDCDRHRRQYAAEAARRLTQKQRDYDRDVARVTYDFPQGCSCHIYAPCNYCVKSEGGA